MDMGGRYLPFQSSGVPDLVVKVDAAGGRWWTWIRDWPCSCAPPNGRHMHEVWIMIWDMLAVQKEREEWTCGSSTWRWATSRRRCRGRTRGWRIQDRPSLQRRNLRPGRRIWHCRPWIDGPQSQTLGRSCARHGPHSSTERRWTRAPASKPAETSWLLCSRGALVTVAIARKKTGRGWVREELKLARWRALDSAVGQGGGAAGGAVRQGGGAVGASLACCGRRARERERER